MLSLFRPPLRAGNRAALYVFPSKIRQQKLQKLSGVSQWRQFHYQTQITQAKEHTMKSMFLALALCNGSPAEQDQMLGELMDADPALAFEVLEMADDLSAVGDDAQYNINGWHIENFSIPVKENTGWVSKDGGVQPDPPKPESLEADYLKQEFDY